MELIWSNDGVSTLLLPAKILIFSEEKENKSTKFITSYGTLKGNYSPEEIAVFRDKYSQIVKRDLE